ncbi:MAG: transposase, partial [Chloroflexi bacterium]|nr:transposase [Chloroflexota bacterium]
LEKLTKLGAPLEKLNKVIDWDICKAHINEAFTDELKDKSKGGRPPFDKLIMFKALLIQRLYNLSDAQLKYQIIDRACLKRFLGLKKSDKVPDS